MANPLYSIPGYGGYAARRDAIMGEGQQELQSLGSMLTLADLMQKQKQASTARELTDKYLSTLGDGPDAQTMRAYGQINPSGLLEALVKQKMEKDLLASESARLGLNQRQAPAQPQPQEPQVLTGKEPFAAKSGDMAGLSGFQGNYQELMMQIAKSDTSPQDKQMMFSQLQEQMRGTGQQSQKPQSGLPAMPAQFAGITREMALDMQRSPVKQIQLQGKQIGDWYEKRDMLELQGQQREDMLRLAKELRPEPAPQQFTDAQGKLWEKSRGGAWEPSMMPTGVQLSSTPKVSPGQKAADQAYGKEYAEYQAGGGSADVEKQLAQLESVVKQLGKKDNDYTGGFRGLLPDRVRSITNPAAIDAKNMVEEVAQRNLRSVLGAQFTQVEGERLIARAYNDQMSPEVNKRRVEALIKQIGTAAKTKDDAARYFEEHGTLAGWKGRFVTLSDFDNAITNADNPKGKASSPTSPSASGQGGVKFLGFE